MSMTGFVRGGVAAVVLLITMSACGSVGSTTPVAASQVPSPTHAISPVHSPSPIPVPAPTVAKVSITLARTGGLAGAKDRVVIDPDGTWVRADRAGTQTHGQLSVDQIAEIQALAHSLVAARETSPPTSGVTCADGRTYALSAGTATVSYTDCSVVRPTITAQMVALIVAWTLA